MLEHWDHGVDSSLEHGMSVHDVFCCPDCLILDARSTTAYVSKDVGNQFHLCFCDHYRNSHVIYIDDNPLI